MKKLLLVITIVGLSLTILYGCGNGQNKPADNSTAPTKQVTPAIQPPTTSQQEENIPIDKGPSCIIDYKVTGGEVANYLTYNHYQHRSMNISGLKVFEEFSTRNEGVVSINDDSNDLIFDMTKYTGTITGACDGPRVFFKMDLAANVITDKKFYPAPDYAKAGKPEFAEHSGEVIELTDKRMIEIGEYFKRLIMKLDPN